MSAQVPVPVGFRMTLDRDTKRVDVSTLFGGSPARIMRLTETGRAALNELLTDPIYTRTAGRLARRLSDAGLMHPHPPALEAPVDATVIIPNHDRPEMLARCLDALGSAYPVLVVDDASTHPERIAEVCATHDAALVRREVNSGPGAARNSGLAHTSTEIIVFLDSDCVPPADLVDRLAAHLADPMVGAAAPRIAAIESDTSAGRYARTCGSLDLGPRAARVMPRSRVAYVPTAALAVRRAALLDVAHAGAVFDPSLRYGEDVDLDWRLDEAGWRIRYDPTVTVHHAEPDAWPALLARRFRYGTSAGPLARRHPNSMAPLVLHPWSLLTVVGLLARRPLLATAAFAGSVHALSHTLRRAQVRREGVVRGCATAVHQTWLGLGRMGTQLAAPALVAAIVLPAKPGRRAAAMSLLIAPPLTAWFARKPDLDPARFVAGHIADDLAYGAGVWAGSIRARTSAPFRPTVSTRMVRVSNVATKEQS
jgi:mycofactocin system glycosyltransferase